MTENNVVQQVRRPVTDIILPIWNNLTYTKLCIESIYNNTEVPFRITIIDNGSTDGTKEYLDKLFHEKNNIRLIHNEENKGWCMALNQGLEASSNEYVCFLNNDTIVTRGWLKSMQSKFKLNIAAVGPTSNAVSGRQHIKHNNPRTAVEEVPYLIGFCMLLKKSVLDILKSFDGHYIDERFGLGSSEEIDLCIRLRKNGYTLLIDRSVYIHHFCSKTLENVTENLTDYHAEKHKLLKQKWGEEELNKYLAVKRPPKVLIGIPSNGDVNYKFFLSCLTMNLPAHVAWDVLPRNMPDVARNHLAEEALSLGFDYVLFIDDDMLFDDRDILGKLLAHDVDICGVIAHTRLAPYYPCVFEKSGPTYKAIDVHGEGLREVDALGASFLLVKTEVFKNMPQPWFEFKPIKLAGIEKNRLGEDVAFTRKAKELGFGVYVDGDIQIGHIGLPQIVTRDTWKQFNETLEQGTDYIHKIKIA